VPDHAAHRHQPARRRRRLLWPLLISVTLIGLLFIGVYPTRTYLSQRSSLARAEHQLDVLQTENAKLDERVKALDTDAEIERIAREQYNYVLPGEEAYAILPAPPAPIALPHVWPFTGLAEKLDPAQPAPGSTPSG
jgi:cell division protein FtsB